MDESNSNFCNANENHTTITFDESAYEYEVVVLAESEDMPVIQYSRNGSFDSDFIERYIGSRYVSLRSQRSNTHNVVAGTRHETHHETHHPSDSFHVRTRTRMTIVESSGHDNLMVEEAIDISDDVSFTSGEHISTRSINI